MVSSFSRQFDLKTIAWLVLAIITGLVWTSSADAQFDGFTEPFRTIELASDESGLIGEMLVKEGDRVGENQSLAKLSSEMQQVQLELAQHLASTNSNLVAAEQTLTKREQILRQVSQLRSEGHANENELTRAQMERDLAWSKYQSAKDESIAREIELRRAMKQLEKRTVVAPFSGVIARVHRKQGEFLSPVRPELFTLVNVDQLYATFNIPSSSLDRIKIGETYQLEVGNAKNVPAVLESFGVQTDAESGTVRVKLLIQNQSQQLRAGEPCIWNF